MLNKLGAKLSRQIQTDEVAFFEAILGLPIHYHLGQVRWVANSHKTINILRPGNKWGKSLMGAGRHLWHAALKPLLPKGLTDEEWLNAKYDTLNFGPGYEQAREILRMARDMCEGNIMLPEEIQHDINPYTGDEYGSMNKSVLKGWFLTQDKSEAVQLPNLGFWTNVNLLGRSFDQMGQAFKMKALAYASGDECADIAELWTFTNGTLLPRMATVKNPQIDYYGTPQPEGHDYMMMIEMAEEDMKKPDWKENGMWYVQKGSMYENVFIPRATIAQIEAIADPVLREQIINGEHVEVGDKYFGSDRTRNIIDKNLTLIEQGEPGRKYITAVDFAGGESVWADFTVIMTIDYTSEPYKIVQFRRFKGGDVPIPMQYQLAEEICLAFGGKGKIIIDSSALGGKNAMAFLSHLLPISAEFGPNQSSTLKKDMLAALKIALDGGQSGTRRRERVKDEQGDWVDKTKDWGLLRSPDIPVLITELQNYKVDDTHIRQDCVMTLMMIIHWIEMRRPKNQRRRAVDFDMLS